MSTGEVLELPVGAHKLLNWSGGVRYKNEAELRDGTAALAWLNGWDVATEVTTATGGRADIVLTAPNGNVIPIELKTSLTTARAARIGFQQADGYHRHFAARTSHRCFTILSAVEVNYEVAAAANDLYPNVYLMHWGRLASIIRGWGWQDFTAPGRLTHVAKRRRWAMEDLLLKVSDEHDRTAKSRRSSHLARLSENYPAMASTLRNHLASIDAA